MFNWEMREMKLMKEEKENGSLRKLESSISLEDKIMFIDKLQDGVMTYIKELREKLMEDSRSMPKNIHGEVKTVSLLAWLKRNDPRKLVKTDYLYGDICLFNCHIHLHSMYCFDYDDFAERVFYHQLNVCLAKEKLYFREHDEYEILKTRLLTNPLLYTTTFGVLIGERDNHRVVIYDYDEDNDQSRDITVEELKELLAKYDELQQVIEKMTAETDITY